MSHFIEISSRSVVHFTLMRHPFFRSYGAILPSSLTRVISSALGYSPHLPVSVYGTITRLIHSKGFSRQRGIGQFARSVDWAPLHPSSACGGLQVWTRTSLPRDGLTFCFTPKLKHQTGGVRILTHYPSPTPFGLGLGSTNPGRINLPQETLDFRRLVFSSRFSLLIPA